MDYKRLGVYSLKKDSVFNGNFLKVYDGHKYEIHEFPIGRRYVLGNSVVMVECVKFPLKKRFRNILVSENFLFICYDKILEIFDLRGSLVRRIESSEDIICGTGGFLVFDRVHYILNRLCETVFVTHVPNIMDFTEDGVIMSINEHPVDGDSNPDHKGNLIVQSMYKKILYDRTRDPVVEFDDITVYEGIVDIRNVVSCSSIKLETLRSHDYAEHTPTLQCMDIQQGVHKRGLFLDCIVVLCKDCVFVIYDNVVVRKQLVCQLTHIIPERFVVHNYVQEVGIYDCILMLSCFRAVRLFRSEGIESFLIGLMSSGVVKKLYEKFIDGLRANATIPCNVILCRAYRQVDDRLKEILDQFIIVDRLDVDELYYLIIYKPDLTERFVQMCKRKRRLFYLDDLKSFFEKTNRASELKRIFLQNGILIFEYCGLEKLIEIERSEINAQRACFLSSIQ